MKTKRKIKEPSDEETMKFLLSNGYTKESLDRFATLMQMSLNWGFEYKKRTALDPNWISAYSAGYMAGLERKAEATP